MTSLKLKKIPDNTPVKLALTLPPEVHADLLLYAEVYSQEHGLQETPSILASHMIAVFMAADSGFRKAKQTMLVVVGVNGVAGD